MVGRASKFWSLPWTMLLTTVFLLLVHGAQGFTFVTPATIEGTSIDSPEIELYFTDNNWNESGYLVAVVLTLNDTGGVAEYTAKNQAVVALCPALIGSLVADSVVQAKKAGFTAVLFETILGTPHAGFNNYIIESVDDNDKIPTFEITATDFATIKSRMALDLVTVNLTRGDDNAWKDSFESGGMIVWQVILSLSALGCIILAIYRLFQFSQKGGCRINLATFGVTLSLISNLVALGYFIADPLGCRRHLNFHGNSIWMTLPWSFTLVNTLSVCLFWSTIVKKSMKRRVTFLSARESVVLTAVAVVCFGQDITLSALRGYHIQTFTLLWLITGVVYTILMLLMVGWFFKKGVSILKTLSSQSAMAGTDETGQTVRVANPAEVSTKLILLSSFGNIIFCCLLPVLITNLFYQPPVYVAIFFFIYSSLQWSSWVQLMTYVPRS